MSKEIKKEKGNGNPLLSSAFRETPSSSIHTCNQTMLPVVCPKSTWLHSYWNPFLYSKPESQYYLVLLCLQVFLLITAFTSTDAAALVTDDQQQSPDLEGTAGRQVQHRNYLRISCAGLSGGCWPGAILPPTKPRLKEEKNPST